MKVFSFSDRKKRKIFFMFLFYFSVCLFILILNPPVIASDYSLDYDYISYGGNVCQTANYNICDTLNITNIEENIQSSSDYSLTTLIGLDEEPMSRIEFWMIY